ncbi:MAG TPA: hypothetical protein VGH40_11820 [Roseiarcus sp.]|jgi:hypothetical protein
MNMLVSSAALTVGVSAVGAEAKTSANSRDAALFDLVRQWRKNASEFDAAMDEQFDAEERTAWPDVPEALFERADDRVLNLRPVPHFSGRGWYFPSAHLLKPDAAEPMWFWTFGDDGRWLPQQSRARARAEEIIKAAERHEQATRAAERASGLVEAKIRTKPLSAKNRELRQLVINSSASTLEGLLAKASVAAWCFDSLEEIETCVKEELEAQGPTGDVIAVSLLLDLARMAAAGGTGAVTAAAAMGAAPALRGDVKPSAPVAPDPVFAAITRHKAAWQAWTAAEGDGGELSQADDAAAGAAHKEEQKALNALLRLPPTTIEGMRAAIKYTAAVCKRGDVPEYLATFTSTLLESPVLKV